MYRVVMYNDEKKVIDVETTNYHLMRDVAIAIFQAIDFYKNYKEKVKIK